MKFLACFFSVCILPLSLVANENLPEKSLQQQAQSYEKILEGYLYISESDYPWKAFYSTKKVMDMSSATLTKVLGGHVLEHYYVDEDKITLVWKDGSLHFTTTTSNTPKPWRDSFFRIDMGVDVRKKFESYTGMPEFNYHTDYYEKFKEIAAYRKLQHKLEKDFSSLDNLSWVRVQFDDCVWEEDEYPCPFWSAKVIIFLLGRTAEGHLVGLQTVSVET